MILTWLLHVLYSSAIAYVGAMLIGNLSPWLSGVSLVLGLWLGRRHAKGFLKDGPEWKFFSFTKGETGLLEMALVSFILYAAARHFIWLLFPTDFTWATLSLNNYGDLPMHINFIRALANGIAFPPRNPIYAAELLRYPYGIDLYNAMWEQLGMRLQGHLAVVGMLATIASIITLRAFGGWAAIGAFFFSGGLGGWEILRGSGLQDFSKSVDWKNLFLAVFITQRGMLVALPVGLFLLVSMRRHFSGERVLRSAQLIQIGLIWGILPFFHLHAFVAISAMLLAMAIEYNPAKWGLIAIRQFFFSRTFAAALLPACYWVLFSTGGLKKASIVHLHWGWVAKPGDQMNFLVQNFGPWLFIPLLIAAYLLLARKRFPPEEKRRLWFEFALYSGLMLFFYNVMFAPWEWDNIKLLIWPYLGFARLLWKVCDRNVEPTLIGNFERPLFALILFLSGIVTIGWTLQAPQGRMGVLYQFSELANTEGALAQVPTTAVLLTAPHFLHQVTYFGRLRALGYEGNLWSHGIDSQVATAKSKRIMAGDIDSIALARELGVTHIFWGPFERLEYGDVDLPWMHQLQNVSRVPGYAIYAVK